MASKKAEKNKQLDEVVKGIKNLQKSIDFIKTFEKKKDRATTPGSRWTRKHQAAYLKSIAEGEKKRSTTARLQEKFQWEQRKTAYNQLKALNQAGKNKAPIASSTGKPDARYNSMPQVGVFKKFNAQMKSVGQMINPKGMDKKKVASEGANAMKGVMKFAVGGSIVGMLGKKLFDSSPLLKTMMSLFNTSIMLIFRPIGDFIGSFLRPIMLFFMKNIAIPFYKNSKHAMGLGEQYGKQALGFLLKPAETIHAAIVTAMADTGLAMFLDDKTINKARDYDGMAHWQLDQIKEAGMDPSNQFDKNIAEHGWTHMKGLIADVWTGGKEKQGGGKQHGITATGTSTPGATQGFYEDIAVSAEVSAGLMEDVEGFMSKALIDGELVETEWDELADIMGRAKLFGVDTSRAIEFIRDQMSDSAAKLSDSWKKFQTASVRGGVGKDATKLEPAKKEIAKYRTDTSGGWGMGGVPSAGTGESINATRSSSTYAAQALKNITQQASATNTRTQINSLQSAIDSGRFVGKTGHEQEQLLKALVKKSHVGVAGQALLNKAQRATDNGQVKSGSDKEARKHAAAFSAAMTLYNMVGGEKPQMGDLTNIVNGKPSGSQGYANGGLITEPIFGIGRSGQTYTFGERGQETVTPGRGGTNYTLNINVGNVTREADFDKLKPLIQRWILEANSRRGVV